MPLKAMKNYICHYCKSLLIVFLFLVFSSVLNAQFYYGHMQTFGKSRPVYNNFQWNFFRFPSYDVFYYKNGANNARYIASILPEEIKKIEEYFGGTIDVRFQVFCYNSLSDLKQSNILGTSQESYDTANITQNIGYHIFIYGMGEHEGLRRQLRAALMEVFLNYMVGGGKRQGETIRDLRLSEWFTDGITAYYSTPSITPEILQVIKEKHSSGAFRSMKSYDEAQSTALGYSIWYYIHSRYGDATASSIVLRSIALENEGKAIEEILGIPLKQITRQWAEYYSILFSDESFKSSDKKSKKIPHNTLAHSKYLSRIDDFASHPSLPLVSYVIGEEGLYKIYIIDTLNNKRYKILTGGYRIPQNRDISIPRIAWVGNKEELFVLTEKHGDIFASTYDVSSRGKKHISTFRLSQIDKVLDIDFSPDGKRAVISGVKDGYSDLYVYNPTTGTTSPLTRDSYDDLSPRFYPDSRHIAFVSTRVSDTLKPANSHNISHDGKDIFVYDLLGKDGTLVRLSSSSLIDESYPIPLGIDTTLYAHNKFSSLTLQVAVSDSVVSHIDTTTHYRTQVNHYSTHDTQSPVIENDKSSYLSYHRKRYVLLPLDTEDIIGDNITHSSLEKDTSIIAPSSSFPINIYDYHFDKALYDNYSTSGINIMRNPYIESEVPYADTTYSIKTIDDPYFEKFKRMYRNTFFPIKVSEHITNAFLNIDYQPFTGSEVSPPSSFGGMVSVGISDLLRDYTFMLGINTNFSSVPGYSLLANSELSFGVYNDRHRIKYGAMYYRRSMVQDEPNHEIAYITSMLRGQMYYPFSPVSTASVTLGIRRDTYRYLSINEANLMLPTLHRDYVSLNLSYVYDNSTYYDINLRRGFRGKAFAEVYQGLYSSPVSRTMINLGIDARYYMRVHKNIIWANRIAFGTSIGGLKLLYYLGGVDRDFNPIFSSENPASQEYNWGFQTIATPMRGFPQNARYGNSFMVLNSEFRIPIFQYLSRNTIRLKFIRHFQLVPFVDMGAAWTASTPWASSNEYNKKTITQGDITVILNRSLDPFIMGYGIGLRTYFLGYFIRADWAWGHDSGLKVPSRFYLSLGFDF